MYPVIKQIGKTKTEVRSVTSKGNVQGDITFRACSSGSVEAFVSIECSVACLLISFDEKNIGEFISELQRLQLEAQRLKDKYPLEQAA